MMELECYKTLWGHNGSFAEACQQARQAGFRGIEGPAPASRQERERWRRHLEETGLLYIAEICTAGSYIPNRSATIEDHLMSLEQQLEYALELAPQLVTCLGGCDAWTDEQSMVFFSEAMRLAQKHSVSISFETHRGRSFFNPWVTARICEQLTDQKLTADFIHWCLVCERLMDVEHDVLLHLVDRMQHIHARVRYEQGPQVTDPRLARFREALHSHGGWWRQIWGSQQRQRYTRSTLTPEFGPDGYQQIDDSSGAPVGDLWEINCWMATSQRAEFQRWQAMQHTGGGIR